MENDAPAATLGDASWLIRTGVVNVLFGIVCMLAATLTGVMVIVLIGAMVLASSVLQIIAGVQLKKGTKGRGWSVFGGALGVIVGFYMVGKPLHGAAILTYVLAIFLMLDGVLRAAGALELRPHDGWRVMLAAAVISILLGLLLLAGWPLSGAWAIGIFFGIHVALLGAARIAIGVAAKRFDRAAS